MQNLYSAFTAKATGITNVLTTACGVAQVANVAPGAQVDLKFQAIWDTGATSSVISQAVVDACGLAPIGMSRVHGVSGVSLTEVYLVAVFLPNGVCFSPLRVTKGNLGASCQVLIGMYFIASGDFSVTNAGGKTVFSYRHPSQATIDYVQEHQESMVQKAILPVSIKPNSSSWRPPSAKNGKRKKK
jgi:hypothetical protein